MLDYAPLFSLIGVLASALIAAKALIKSKVIEKENKELKTNYNALDILFDFSVFNKIVYQVNELFATTKADRYLTLYATNGKSNFKFVTSMFEHHKDTQFVRLSEGAVNKYVQLQFDLHYLNLLKEVEHVGPVFLDVIEMPECDLKNIYISEKVFHSCVMFLNRIEIDKENDLLLFCSIATHSAEKFTPLEITIIKQAHGVLKDATEKLKASNIKKN